MKNCTSLKYLLLCTVLLSLNFAFGQDFNIQHLTRDVPRAGATSSITAVSSLNSAFVLNNNNRKAQAGPSDLNSSNQSARDLSGAVRLTATNTVTYYRESNSINSNTRFDASVWEYTGTPGGLNEFIVRGRYIVNLNGATNSETQSISGVSNANRCIPFITGIISNVSAQGAHSGTAIAYLENASTLRVQKGSNLGNVTVYITLVEFTGSNWTVLHGDSGNTGSQTGTITLRVNSDGTGTATNVTNWSNAIIFDHHRGDTSGNTQAIAHNWPLFQPGSNNQSVNWTFDGNHSSNGTNRHFVHVLNNPEVEISRFNNNLSNAGVTSIDISSASLTNLNQSLLVGTSISSGPGTAYGRGWRNYYLNSTTQAAHWAHRSGNTMSHAIQIIDVSAAGTPPSYCISNGNTTYQTGVTNVTFESINNSDGPAKDNGYEDFTATHIANVTQGGTETLSVSVNTDGNYRVHAFAWIDWNQDSDFNDPGESYNLGTAQNVSSGTTSLSPLTINIPAGATIGTTRMRVSAKYNSDPSLCETDFDGEVEDYTINIISPAPQPEINLVGNGNNINDGDIIPTAFNDTDFGSIGVGGTIDHTFTIQNTGTATLNLTGGTPLVDISGDASFTILTQPSGNTINAGNSRTFVVRFAPTANGTVTADISIDNNDSNENPYNFRIQGTGVAPLTEGPGGVTNDLALWLKGTDGLAYNDGDRVSLWADQGRGANATAPIPEVRPTYRNNPNKNVNFNPVVEFDNIFTSFSIDDDYSYDNPDTEFLQGTSGLYTQDIFVVVIPDDTVINRSFGFMDLFCGDANIAVNSTDATGLGMGDYTGRVSNESICFALDSYTPAETPPDGYAVYDGPNTTYSNVGIINARNNPAVTQQQLFYNANNIETGQNDIAEFLNINDSRYWIGRSEGWEATLNARVAEIITYSSRKSDTDLTQERNRIQSYLAVKYGITLGVNGTSQDYVNSDGNVIWDVNTGVSDNDVFNYDIAGIGRDDASDLYQKQSRSVNNAVDLIGRTQGVLTMGITDLYPTNSQNPHTVGNKQFLMWGNDGVSLSDPAVVVNVDMSTDILPAISGGTPVQFNGIARTWKVVESGGDFPEVKVSMLRSAIRTATPPDGRYLMFISDAPNFGPTADYRVMDEDTNELGEPVLTANYDFDGTKYITFGWAPERVYERSVYFNGIDNYIDMENNLDLNTSGFTISAWIKRDVNSGNKSILSKRATAYGGVRGYDLRILSDGKLNIRWRNSSSANQELTSSIPIPLNVWHHVAVIYNGTTATIYIDGIADTSANLTPPAPWTHSFLIGAGGKGTIDGFFHGNIDEVRIWNTALTEPQLRFIINQEIENNSGFVSGTYFQNSSINPTKNDIATLPWSQLAAYYPMTTYTYTNTKDESGNGIQGALRSLRTVDRQTAPLPYISTTNGDWDNNSTWLNGNMQYIPGSNSIVDPKETVDWNIVVANHTITLDNSSIHPSKNNLRCLLSLDVQNSGDITVEGDTSVNEGNGLLITHYLRLDGVIDLEGESQLVQNIDSDFAPTSSGRLERDQQGTADVFTYNYWSSPVGTRNSTTNNNSYTVPTVLQDGNIPINFISSGYNGSNTSPIGIADFWIWKFANQPTGQYSAWQHVRSTGSILAGEGFTMKGPGTGAIADDQNYVFNGKPNNGNINLTLAANNDYLVGNPYPSALDADQFILDNGPVIGGTGSLSGTLYFWEHWGGGSHILQQYQGGYATYNLSGGLPSASQGASHPDVGMGGTPRKTPGRYIPVSQGFFVTAEGSGGIINFNNGQRIFEKEDGSLSGSSVFMRSFNENYYRIVENENDPRMKFRIGLKSVNEIQRQLLLTIDEKATVNKDWGYDAVLNETQIDDMYWIIEDENYIIQGSDVLDEFVRYPVGIKLANAGINEISINVLENVPSDITVYVHDKDLDYYHDLNDSPYEFHSMAGEHLNRFDILFNKEDAALSVGDDEFKSLNAVYANNNESIILINPTLIEVKSMELLNVIGQTVTIINNISVSGYSEYEVKNLSSGTYIIKMNTASGSVSKKVLVD